MLLTGLTMFLVTGADAANAAASEPNQNAIQAAMEFLVNTISHWGPLGVFILMAMESSVLPVPSELVVPPAGYLVVTEGWNPLVVIACGTLGSLLGAYVNYFVSARLGRPLVLKYGKYVLISEKKFLRVEAFFLKHGEIATFIGRLLPVIRHLISIPAGLARMNHLKFSLYTLAGAAIWVTVLTYIGYFIAKLLGTSFAKEELNKLFKQYSTQAIVGVVVFSAAVIALYIWWQRRQGAKAQGLDQKKDDVSV